MKKFKLPKLLSVFLAVVLLLQMFSGFSIVVAQTDWTGYTAIWDKTGLDAIRNNLGGKYYLTADIIFTAADFAVGGAFYNGGAGWNPIGTDNSNAFTGTFDGNGHIISSLNINITSNNNVYVGLFGFNQGSILNVGILNGSITVLTTGQKESGNGGSIAGGNSGTISN